jgi:SH3-like domain-containing protein
MFRLFLVFFLIISTGLYAAEREIPRFVTIKSAEVNVRTGPNTRYPIKFVFIKKNEPVEVVAHFDNWRKIRNINGEDGWVHETMLSGKRHVIIIGKEVQALYKKPKDGAPRIILLEPNVRGHLLNCEKEWCRIEVSDKRGWIKKVFLYGVYENE